MINPMDLTGKNILIAGASSGIGKDTALLLSKLGARLILISRNREKLESVVNSLAGSTHEYVPYDLSCLDGIEELINNIVKCFGSLNGLVYCAGNATMKPLNMLKASFLHEIMKVNLYAFIEIVRCVSKKNNYVSGMSIVGISSVAADVGDKGNIAYCTSKAAMNGSIRAMGKELSVKGIRINSIKPGFIKTDMYQNYANAISEQNANNHILNRQYLGLGETNDISNMIAYLLSDVSKLITGTEIAVDGGYLT